MSAEERLREELVTADRAYQQGDWTVLAASVRRLAGMLPARLELLARGLLDLVDESELDVAAHVWGHLHEAALMRTRLAPQA